jgi:protein required for attachment to host cells
MASFCEVIILARALERGAYERIVVVAPLVMLGDLRAAISDPVRAKIVGEVAHDLTKIPNNEVAGRIEDISFV